VTASSTKSSTSLPSLGSRRVLNSLKALFMRAPIVLGIGLALLFARCLLDSSLFTIVNRHFHSQFLQMEQLDEIEVASH